MTMSPFLPEMIFDHSKVMKNDAFKEGVKVFIKSDAPYLKLNNEKYGIITKVMKVDSKPLLCKIEMEKGGTIFAYKSDLRLV